MIDQQSSTIKKFTRFNSQAAPQMILARVSEVLKGEGVEHKVFDRSYKIKVMSASDRGQLTCTMQVFTIAPGLSLVDWRRGQGDVMAYYKFYQDVRSRLDGIAASR